MGILMKAFVCLGLLLLFCSYIKASATGIYTSPLVPIGFERPCHTFSRCERGPPHGVGKQVVDNKPAKKSVIEPQGRGGYNGGQP